MRELDWRTSAVGPVSQWPQSLRTAVSICLGSRHPIVLWWGPDRTMFYNDAYRPMLGASKHPQFLGRSGRDCWSDIWDIIGPMMDQVLATGEATWSEDFFLLMSRHGYVEETYFTFSYSPIRDEDGRPAGIFNACTESTGRVIGERRLRTLRELAIEARSAREAARTCAEVLDHDRRDIPFALVYLRDESGTGFELAAQLGFDGEVAMQWPLAEVVERRAPLSIAGLRARALPKGPWAESPDEALALPIAMPGGRPDGVIVLGISPHRAFDDDYRGFFELVAGHVSTAIANARALESERARAESLAEIDRAKTAFFSNVSHEFRTPLTLMLGHTEQALASPTRTLGGDELDAVHRNGLRLLKLVNNLLDFSRIEAGRATACFEPTDVSRLTASLASAFHSAAARAGLQLTIDCPPLDELVAVDQDMWEKIVLNLISNALKFTFEGEVAARVRAIEDGIELVVRDTGTGIPAHELGHLFERFHRVQGARARTHEGTGIGLALVHELVKLHGGRIAVRSEVGIGTTFTVTIPRNAATTTARRSDARESTSMAAYVEEARHWSAPKSAPIVAGEHAHILLADDNADLRAYVTGILASEYEIEPVEDGVIALAAARARKPDLVLSDVMMPRLDGFGFLRALREDEKLRDVPFILLSARAGEEATVEGLDAGADDYLVKPFSARELRARVRTHLQLMRLRQSWAAELARANEDLEAFSYSVSHDLRAPLRTIHGFTEILLEDHAAELSAPALVHLRKVVSGAEQMSALIEDMLRLARVGQQQLRIASVDLSALARSIGSTLAAAHTHVVRFEVDDGLRVDGDRGLLQIALENLLGNAWKFTAKVEAPMVRFGAHERDGETVFYVRDNGAGFDPSRANRLFVAFQRLHGANEFPGSGIGLATVHRVLRKHGGRITAEGTPNGGATFEFTLPRATPLR